MTLSEGLTEFYKQQAQQPKAPEPCSLSYTRPNVSLSMKVRRSDRQKAIAEAAKRGVPTEFTPEGNPVFTSRAHQKSYRKAFGYANLDGGFGD